MAHRAKGKEITDRNEEDRSTKDSHLPVRSPLYGFQLDPQLMRNYHHLELSSQGNPPDLTTITQSSVSQPPARHWLAGQAPAQKQSMTLQHILQPTPPTSSSMPKIGTHVQYDSSSIAAEDKVSPSPSPYPDLHGETDPDASPNTGMSTTASVEYASHSNDVQSAAPHHVCTECHKEFPRPTALATHMNSHTGNQPFECPMGCGRRFSVLSNARRHLSTHGLDWKQFREQMGEEQPVSFSGFAPPMVIESAEDLPTPTALVWQNMDASTQDQDDSASEEEVVLR